MKNRVATVSALVLAACCLGAAQPPYPQEVGDAEKVLTAWMGPLRGKSEVAVEQALGPPAAKATWSPSEGKQRPMLTYHLPTGGELTIYFGSDGKVLLVNHTLRLQ
jgi:hypothetical protein